MRDWVEVVFPWVMVCLGVLLLSCAFLIVRYALLMNCMEVVG